MSGGVTAIAVALGTTAAVVGTVINVIVIALVVAVIAYTAYMIATMKTPSIGGAGVQSLRDRTQVVRSAVEARRYIYGQIEVSGPLIYSFSTGLNNNFLYLVIALAGHECEEIGDIYLGDKLSTDSVFSVPTAEQGHYKYVMDKGRVWVVDIPASTRSLVNITKYTGSPDQQADPELISVTNGQWTANHRLRGVAYIVVKLEYLAAAFPNGIPNIKAIVKGNNQIYDPRTGTIGYTNNWALCIRDFLTKPYGVNCLPDEIDEDQVISAANICDEDIYVKTGTGIGYTTDGSHYDTERTLIKLISGTGTILAGDHISIAVVAGTYDGEEYESSNQTYTVKEALRDGYITLAVGLIYELPPVPCVVGVVGVNTEKRYTCNGSFKLDQTPLNIMQSILTAAVGTVVWSQGSYWINPASYATPDEYVITESDLAGSLGVQPAKSQRDKFNTVRGTFADPANFWQPVDFPPQTNSTALAADGRELTQDIDLLFTTSSATAQRLAKIHLERELQGIVVNFPGKLTLFSIKPQDTVKLSISQMGWSEKVFRVINWEMTDTAGINLVLREEASESYDWNSGMESTQDPAPNTNLPNPWFVTPPLDLLLSEELTGSNGAFLTKLISTIVPTDDPFITRYEVQVRRDDLTNWIDIGGNGLVSSLLGVEDGYIYNVRARSFSGLGVPSAYIEKSALVLGLKAPPPDVTGARINCIGTEAHLLWAPVTDVGLSHYTVKFSPAITGASWSSSVSLVPVVSGNSVTVPAMVGSYLIKAVRYGGSESVTAAMVTSSIAGIAGLNAVELIEPAPLWNGTHTNTVVVDGSLRLNSADTLSDWIRLSVVKSLSYGINGYQPTGVYQLATVTDLGAVYTSRVTAMLYVFGNNTQNVMGGWTPLLSVVRLSGVDPGEWDAALQISTTNDNPIANNWSAWQEFVVGDYSARALRFRLLLFSYRSTILVEVSSLSVLIDMPDRIISAQDVTCPAAGLRVDFIPPFRSLKALAVDGQDMITGDYKTITGKDETGYTLRFFNASGTGVQRTFDAIATGYGQEV